MNLPVWNSASSRDVQDQWPILIESPADEQGDRSGKSARARHKEERRGGKTAGGRRACDCAAQRVWPCRRT
eukprot:8317730-Pyramimonas_sp.AAC.1